MRRARPLIRPALVMVLILAVLPGTLGPRSARPGAQVARPTASPTPVSSASPVPVPLPTPDPRPAPLTLDMAVGQMMAASFGGPNVTDGLRHLILDQKVGTVLIFGDNFSDAASLARLTAE